MFAFLHSTSRRQLLRFPGFAVAAVLQDRCPLKFVIFAGECMCWSLFLIKLQHWRGCNFIKRETSTQGFSCECYETFKNNFFYRILLVAASWFKECNEKNLFPFVISCFTCNFDHSKKIDYSIILIIDKFINKTKQKHLLNFCKKRHL